MKTDDERARMYHDLVDEVLSEAASRHLEELMTMTYEHQGRPEECRAPERIKAWARRVATVETVDDLFA